MVFTLIGCRPSSFKGSKGEEVNGVRLYLLRERTLDGVIGQMCEDVYVRADKLPIEFRQDKAAFIGLPICVDYNSNGKVDSVYFERG